MCMQEYIESNLYEQLFESAENFQPPFLSTDGAENFYARLGGPVVLDSPSCSLGLNRVWSTEDAFVIVYSLVDDLYKQLFGSQAFFRNSPNSEPKFTDAEVLTIALVAELAAYQSQRAWFNHVRKNYLHLFPRLCDRTRYGRRIRRLRPAMERIRRHLLFLMNVDLSQIRVVDSFPLSICHMRRVNSSSQPFEYFATVGYCAAKKEYFYGFRVHLITDLRGVPVGYLLTSGHLHDTKGLVFLLEEWSRLEEFIEKMIQILGDKGYVGEEYARRLKEEFGVEILAMRKQYKKDEPVSLYNEIVGKARKIIETTISVLTGKMNANSTNARSIGGLLTNLAAKMTAFNLANYLNQLMGEPVLRVSSIIN